MHNRPPLAGYPDLPFGVLLQFCMDMGAGRPAGSARPYWSQEQLAYVCEDHKVPASKSAIGTWLSGAFLPMEVRSDFLGILLSGEEYAEDWLKLFEQRFQIEYKLAQADRMSAIAVAEEALNIASTNAGERRIALHVIADADFAAYQKGLDDLKREQANFNSLTSDLGETIREAARDIPSISTSADFITFPEHALSFLKRVQADVLDAHRLIDIQRSILSQVGQFARLHPRSQKITPLYKYISTIALPTDQLARDVLRDMFHILVFQSGSFAPTFKMIKDNPLPAITLTTSTFNVLLNRAKTPDAVRAASELMIEKGIAQDYTTLKLLVARAPSWVEAFALFDQAKSAFHDDVDVSLYNALLAACRSYEEATRVFDMMRAAEHIRPDSVSYKYLIKSAPSYEEALHRRQGEAREHQ